MNDWDGQLTLGQGFRWPYQTTLSSWLIFLRANSISADELRKFIVNGATVSKPSCRLNIQLETIQDQLNLVGNTLGSEPEQVAAHAWVSRWGIPGFSEIANANLICLACFAVGYQSPLHQLGFLPLCPWHRAPLRRVCLCGNATIDLKRIGTDTICQRCQFAFPTLEIISFRSPKNFPESISRLHVAYLEFAALLRSRYQDTYTRGELGYEALTGSDIYEEQKLAPRYQPMVISRLARRYGYERRLRPLIDALGSLGRKRCTAFYFNVKQLTRSFADRDNIAARKHLYIRTIHFGHSMHRADVDPQAQLRPDSKWWVKKAYENVYNTLYKAIWAECSACQVYQRICRKRWLAPISGAPCPICRTCIYWALSLHCSDLTRRTNFCTIRDVLDEIQLCPRPPLREAGADRLKDLPPDAARRLYESDLMAYFGSVLQTYWYVAARDVRGRKADYYFHRVNIIDRWRIRLPSTYVTQASGSVDHWEALGCGDNLLHWLAKRARSSIRRLHCASQRNPGLLYYRRSSDVEALSHQFWSPHGMPLRTPSRYGVSDWSNIYLEPSVDIEQINRDIESIQKMLAPATSTM